MNRMEEYTERLNSAYNLFEHGILPMEFFKKIITDEHDKLMKYFFTGYHSGEDIC